VFILSVLRTSKKTKIRKKKYQKNQKKEEKENPKTAFVSPPLCLPLLLLHLFPAAFVRVLAL
jgi:H+/gluconate symporter-like permease